MSRIKILNESTANGIAAGEVVERPASVVKELIENALDAGASVITVEITDGGIRLIRVTDNGCGMDQEDAEKSFVCHATSKITSLDDLEGLSTMGFRGEALSSIAAVSRITLKTRPVGEDRGTLLEVEAGKIVRRANNLGPWGTSLEVRDLFFNQPARYKFLKKDQTEAQYIIILVERFALVRPDVSFRLIKNGKEVLHTPGNNDPSSALYCVYGSDIVNQCIPIESEHDKVKIRGFAGKPELARAGRGEQTIFVNDRIIRSKTITSAVDEAYKTMLMRGKYAFVVLMIYIPAALLDVNVHPQKAEVRFWNDSEVFRAVYHALNGVLMAGSFVAEAKPRIEEPRKIVSPQIEYTNLTEQDQKSFSYMEQTVIQNIMFSENTSFDDMRSVPDGSADTKTPDREDSGSDYKAIQPVGLDTYQLPESSKRDESLNEIKNARFIGILFFTYILLESPDSLIVLDQHAAHEKILFEKLLKEFPAQGRVFVSSQQLLTPEIITLSASDMAFITENHERFLTLGFHYDQIGERDIAIRFAPSLVGEKAVNQAFSEVLVSLKRDTELTGEKYLLALATAACKSAVKAHDRLDPIEVRSLIEQLVLLDNPFTCPHGRPIIVRYSKATIEKEFKRIV